MGAVLEAVVAEPDPASLKLLYVQGTLKKVQKVLGEAGIQVIVLKGVHLGSTVYEDARERQFCDVDLLVRPVDFGQAVKRLQESGFARSSVLTGRTATEAAYYNYGFNSPSGIHVELHRELAGYGRYPISVDNLFQRAEPFQMGNLPLLGLCTEDLLCHLCLHIAKSYFLTLQPKHFQDVAVLVEKRKILWSDFLERTREARCQIGAFYSLKAAMLLHGAKVPDEVMMSLRPGFLRRWWLERYLDPSGYPVYRYPDHTPFQFQARVGLALIDRVRDWPVVLWRHAKVRLLDVVWVLSGRAGTEGQKRL